jgi:hypothetical protein
MSMSGRIHYGPRVGSASNRSEYLETSWGGGGVKCGWRVRPETYRPLCAYCLGIVGAVTSYNPMGLHGLLDGQISPCERMRLIW